MQQLPDTLFSALDLAAREPQRGLIFHSQGGPLCRSWADLAQAAHRGAAVLQEAGVRPGARVGVISADPKEFATGFLAAIACRALPFAVGPASPLADERAHRERLAALLDAHGASHVIAGDSAFNARGDAPELPAHVRVLHPTELAREGARHTPPPAPERDDLCMLQLTSGSTRAPRAVAVTHRNLVENVRATHALLASRGQEEVGVSWLPLWHDMGLIAGLITPLLARNTHVLIPPQVFASSPRVWLEAVHEYRATVSATTNFGLHLAMKRPPRVPGFNLRSLRTLLIGAEPINPDVLRAFERQFAPYGLAPEALCPAYGMAEATLAVSVSRSDRTPVTLCVDRAAFEGEQRIVPAQTSNGLELVSCGTPLPGHRVVVLDASGCEVQHGVVGEIAVEGPSLSPGYYTTRGVEAHATVRGALRSGDLGFIDHGELFVCGREKDLIIVAGRNVHPQLIEWHVGRLEGVRENSIVAFSLPGHDTERVVILAECENPKTSADLPRRIRVCIAQDIGISVGDVVIVRPWTLPKTTSGKVQRSAARTLYLARRFEPVATH